LLWTFNSTLPVTSGITHTTFAGVPLWQWPIEVVVWEYALRALAPDIKRIIELGTFHGGLSLYLWLWAVNLGIVYDGYDMARPSILDTPLGKLTCGEEDINSCFHTLDIHGVGQGEILTLLNSDEKILLVCDDGNKRLEVWNFGAALRPGNYLAVHDWMAEIKPEDIDPSKFAPHLDDITSGIGSLWRFFKRL